MQLGVYLNEAFRNLVATKLRTFLAVLGILVGTASVVAMVSGGELATRQALKQFKALGTNLLAVQLNQQSNDPSQVDNLNILNVLNVKSASPNIERVAPYNSIFIPITFAGKQVNSGIVGATQSLATIMKLRLQAGRFISFLDKNEYYAIIGQGLYQKLKAESTKPILGQQIRLGKNYFTIIGILKNWEQNSFLFADLNSSVVIPLETTKLLSKYASINSILMRIKEGSNIDKLESTVKTYFTSKQSGLNYYFQSAKQIIEHMQKQQAILTVLLGFIGSISLLVGGIGVMNIMLVSVTERRREIGIRLAIGARRRDIQRMFLTEAVVLSLFGGLVGVLLGVLISYIIADVRHWDFAFFFGPPVIGFVVSAFIGIFFGFYPAYKAAKLDPIETLRSE
jgi:putative ABC transport system permease protein